MQHFQTSAFDHYQRSTLQSPVPNIAFKKKKKLGTVFVYLVECSSRGTVPLSDLGPLERYRCFDSALPILYILFITL